MLEAGQQAPDFDLIAVNGRRVTLRGQLEHGQNVLLVFMRYLG